MATFSTRFEMYGDLVVEAENAQEAEEQAAAALIRWNGLAIAAQDVSVDGVTIHPDLTEAAS